MTPVLIDTDPGTDDALAIMMALNSPDLDVVALTTVGGNATLGHTTRNALRIVEHMGASDVPVYRGSARPLRGKYHYGYYYHGPAGLGVRLPAPQGRPHSTLAPELILEMAHAHCGELVVIALGPLTNVARALALEPRLTRWTREIVVMGGAVEVPGNVTPYAEFNTYNDPVAAGRVLNSGTPVKLVGLDVCRQTFVRRGDMPWPPGESRTTRLARRVLSNWFKNQSDRDSYDLCDPLAVVAAFQPDFLEYRTATVAVGTEDTERLGQTIATYGKGPVEVAVSVAAENAMALMARLLQRA